jgi:acylpyruvate hydrolase
LLQDHGRNRAYQNLIKLRVDFLSSVWQNRWNTAERGTLVRLATVRTEYGTRAARVDGDEIVMLDAVDVGSLLLSDDWQNAAAAAGPRRPLNHADLAPVVLRPEKMFCLAANYQAHADEAGRTVPEYPSVFGKFARALVGPNDPIVLPTASRFVDWEAELVAVIGSTARHVSVDDAINHVAGFTVGNDVSMRDWQKRTSQYLQGKTFEDSTPVGPWLVTRDEIGDATDLLLRCTLDGEVVQDAKTSEMIYSVPTVVSYLSAVISLVPGDMIFMGTPSGVGSLRKPPRSLQPGSVLETEIEGIGVLRNTCVTEIEQDARA